MALPTEKEFIKQLKIAFKKEEQFNGKLIICGTKKDMPTPNFTPSSYSHEIGIHAFQTINENRENIGRSPLEDIWSKLLIQYQINQGINRYAVRMSLNSGNNSRRLADTRSPIGIELLFNKQFRCENCHYLTNVEYNKNVREVYPSTTPLFHCKNGITRKEDFYCSYFKISRMILTAIQYLDIQTSEAISPELNRDLHPRYLIGGFIKVYPPTGEEWRFFSGRAFPFYSRNDKERIPLEIIL